MSKKKKKKEKSFTGKMVLVFMIFFMIVVGLSVYSQSRTLYELKKNEIALNEQIDAEKEKKLELEGKQAYYESDEYIEKVAREQLGLVKSGELVFVNSANKN